MIGMLYKLMLLNGEGAMADIYVWLGGNDG